MNISQSFNEYATFFARKKKIFNVILVQTFVY